MSFNRIAGLAGTAVILLVLLIVTLGIVGHNNDQNWQVIQSPSGEVTINDAPGYYWKGFSKVWTYPRTLTGSFSKEKGEGDGEDRSIDITFNDTGKAAISSHIRVRLPTNAAQRRLLHQDFGADLELIRAAIASHLTNCLKASGPVMSASENQSSRKSEFNQIVEDQLARGLYKMRRTEVELSDVQELDPNKHERKARVQATEIVCGEDGQPIIIQPSPLIDYGITIRQFSITGTEYDPQTNAQFAAKKESYLNAERSKAQRQEEVQKRLQIEEQGRRQVAEVEAEQNQKKTRALIEAQQAQEVAVITKLQAVTEAQQKTEVADQAKKEAETLRETAKVKAETAELEKLALISRAQAQQKAIELGGGISEKERVLAQIEADARAKVAESVSKIQCPSTVIITGGGEKGAGMTETMMSMLMLDKLGVLPPRSVMLPKTALMQPPAGTRFSDQMPTPR